MKIRLSLLFAFCLSFSLVVEAQTEQRDSVGVDGGIVPFSPVDVDSLRGVMRNEKSSIGYTPRYSGYHSLAERYPLTVNPLVYAVPNYSFTPGEANLYSWGSGGFYAEGASQNLTGMMGIESGALSFRQHIGALTLSMYGSAAKYGYFQGLSTSWGFGGSLSYQLNENVGVTLFGSYSSPIGIMQPAMMGYVGVSQFGGYVDWRFHPHWGVKVGAQSYRSMAYGGQWEMQPIVMPYYKAGNGVELGVDLGGILYQIMHEASGGKWGGYKNPTIGQPNFGPPPIRPHE